MAIDALLCVRSLGTSTCVATFFRPRVRVGVAVDVAQHDEVAEAPAVADLDDLAVLDGDDRASPAFAKMLIPRRDVLSTGSAAFLPRATRRVAARSEMSSAYIAFAYTGKRPWVSPLSEPTRSAGMPPMKRARMSTELTYQSAWL